MSPKILAALVFILSLTMAMAQAQDTKDKKPPDKKEVKKEDKKPAEKSEPTPLEGAWSVVSLEYTVTKPPADKAKDVPKSKEPVKDAPKSKDAVPDKSKEAKAAPEKPKDVKPKAKEPTTFTFKGNKLTIHRGKKIIGQGIITLDPAKMPALWDYLEAKDVYSPYDAGIYLLEGDTLKLCTSADRTKRPSDFDSKQGQVIVLKKEKK